MRPLLKSWCVRLVGVAVAAALILPAALSAQGAMANGLNYTSTIAVAGEIDTYTFSATTGDAIILGIGEVGADSAFVPWIRLLRPDNVLVGSQSGVLAAQIEFLATQTGTYTVQVASGDSGFNDTGTYTLTLAKAPGAFTISPGDQGGALTNGSNHTGDIHVGDLDMWTFDAAAGDAIIIGIGEVGPDSAFAPWIRLKSPTGQNLGSQSGALAHQIEATATVSGTYTVVVASGDAAFDGAGSYTLTLAKAPGAITISDGDEGGPALNGQNHTGTIHIGDLDAWTFQATAGDAIIIGIGEVGLDSAFSPWIRLKSPTGQNLGSLAGALAHQIEAVATVTGTYTVVVASGDAGFDAFGDYTLTLVKAPGAISISPGDQGGPLTNGSNHTGDIHIGDLDAWTFTATAGEDIIVAIGEVGGDTAFSPWIRLKSPTGQNLGSLAGALAHQIEATATVTSMYTVVVASGDAGFDAAGSYTLTLAKSPGAFTISGGDEGGALTNGNNHLGTIHIGDLDMWSFQATAGEALTVAIGETGPDSAFAPWIRLRSPTGQDLGSLSGVRAMQISATATVTGTYTVVVASGDAGFDASGSYTLTIANTPRAFVVPPGDHGGPIVVGDPNPGIIHIGDLDMWTFVAHEGDPLSVLITDINSPGTDFTPWIRLRSPTGAQIGSQSGATTATILATAPATGIYTILVASGDSGFDGFGDYELTASGTTNTMIRNGDFSAGETFWQFFATPTLAYVVHQVTNGVLQYYRVPPPAGTTNQAVAYQETGVTLPAGAPLLVQFDLANTSSVRKRISVLVLDADFSDLTVCTFWLEPGVPLRTYRMRTHTTQAWVNTALYFYAASAGESGGRYEIDNVSMRYVEEQAGDRTECVDPAVATPQGGGPGPDLLVNGNFDTGTLAPWFTFGTITSQIVNGVFEFIKPSSAQPSGVVAQPTGQAMTAGQILTATFRLGNSSAVRKRVTVILHDSDFTDLSACTFWLAPGQPLSTYEYRTFATKPWANAMLSVYPATLGLSQWIRLDDVTLRRTPGTPIAGTECMEPVGSENVPLDNSSGTGPASTSRLQAGEGAVAGGVPGAVIADEPARGSESNPLEGQTIDLRDATSARLTFDSWKTEAGSGSSRGLVQVSLDGTSWVTLDAIPPSEDWTTVQVDLSAFAGEVVRVRFALDVRSVAFDRAEVWRIRGLSVVVR
jgi:precorrin-6B methylase 1